MSATASPTSKTEPAEAEAAPAEAEAPAEVQENTAPPAEPEAEPASTPAAGSEKPAAKEQQDSKPSSNRPPPGAHHTIILLQPSKHDSTRYYQDFNSGQEAVEGVLRMFETRLKEYNPGATSITYDYNSLCQYLDDMREITVLSWTPDITGYKRYDRVWLKGALQDLLVNMVAAATEGKKR